MKKSLDTPVTQQEIDFLAAFLAQNFDYKTFDIDELRGFLWAIAGSPVPIELDEWLGVIFNVDAGMQAPSGYNPFKSDEQEDTCLNIIFRLRYQAVEQIIDEKFAWPTEYCISDDGQENYQLRQWCRGFIYGYIWLEDAWDNCLQQVVNNFAQGEQEQELFKQQFKWLAFALEYFSSDVDAQAIMREKLADEDDFIISHDKMPTEEVIKAQLLAYGTFGYQMCEMSEQRFEPIRVKKIGRNAPCPCGSGKKHKKCCGN